ncbi:carboxypeptidase B-like [Leguminivora glycinivorella]|uniref:carboxypeptidase B-like n=1 Tax=Leguminivora glycinivorella TaxID=1035111 RepID=UPI00200F3AD7|nr:carboxypeptidase B-like [Leguminivora glycinivorella]
MAKLLLIIFSIIGTFWQTIGINKYNDYTLIQITPYDKKQLKTLMMLTNSDDVDIMKHSHGLNDTADLLVSPRDRRNVEKFAKLRGMGVKRIDHYGRYFDKEVAVIRKHDQYLSAKYNSYEAISKHLKTLSKENRRYVKLQNLGRSYERRMVTLVKISANFGARNPIIFLDAGAHAREWASPAFATYVIDQLVVAAKKPNQEELHGVDWYILPVVNPDGYEFTRSDPDNRMWRKTRSKTWRKECHGVDINRNYDFMWGYRGASFDPCNFQTYAGEKAFSERETRLVRKVMEANKRIKLYISIHSYGEYLIHPWGYTGTILPDEWEKLHRLAQVYSKAVVQAGGRPFKIMSAGQWYPAAGGSDDYAFAIVKIPYAYTLEITNGYQFNYPERLLGTVLPQYYEGLKAMAEEIKREFSKKG